MEVGSTQNRTNNNQTKIEPIATAIAVYAVIDGQPLILRQGAAPVVISAPK